MTRRRIYLAIFILLSCTAGVLTLHAQRTTTVLVAARDVRAGTLLTDQDVEMRRLHEDSVPDGALSSVEAAAGRYVSWPLTAGEPVLGRMLRAQRSGAALTSALDIPTGYRAVAVPVQPAAAVGGMLLAGDRVDVYATPLAGRGEPSAPPADAGPGGDSALLLGHDVLVVQLRSDQGEPLDPSGQDTVRGLNFGTRKLGAVVLAVPAADVQRYAAAITSNAIFLALTID